MRSLPMTKQGKPERPTTLIILIIINTISPGRWGKKVWFTEFARPTTRDPAMELEYMQVLPVTEWDTN